MAEGNAALVTWADRPDPDPRIFYEVWSPKPGKDVIGVILSDVICGVYLHFYDRRDRPCLFDEEKCEGCQRKIDRRWVGFLPCWKREKGRLFIAKITREAYLRCPQFESLHGELRGKVLRLVRSGEARNSRVTATVMNYAGSLGSLPPTFNVRVALERLWFTAPKKEAKDGG